MNKKELIEKYTEDGALLLKDFYDYETEIRPIQRGIYEIIGIIIDKYKLPVEQKPFSSEEFDSGYQELIKTNRSYGGEIYDAIKQIPAFIRLLASEKNENLYKCLAQSDNVGIGGGSHGIRIDNPNENQYTTPWHQEYVNHFRSIDGAVFWSPLKNTTFDMGGLEFLIGSHKEGMARMINTNTQDSISDSNYTVYMNGLRIENIESKIHKYKCLMQDTSPGDALILNFLTIHRSGENKSGKTRWAMQMRYFNFENEEGQRINWQGSVANNVSPQDLYPEYFIQESK